MIAIYTGLYPLAAIVVGGVLYELFRLWLRMRCHCKMAQCYIVCAVVVSLLFTFLCPYYERVQERPIDPMTGEEYEHPHPDTPHRVGEVEKLPITANTSETLATVTTNTPDLHSSKGNFIAPSLVGRAGERLYFLGVIAMLIYFVAQIVWLRVSLTWRKIHGGDEEWRRHVHEAMDEVSRRGDAGQRS